VLSRGDEKIPKFLGLKMIKRFLFFLFYRVICSIKVRAGFNWWETWGEIKIGGFGGRPPFGWRPGALGPMPPLNPALIKVTLKQINKRLKH